MGLQGDWRVQSEAGQCRDEKRREMNAGSSLTSLFPLLIQSGVPTHGMLLPRFGVKLLGNTLTPAQELVFYVIPKRLKLTTRINHSKSLSA